MDNKMLLVIGGLAAVGLIIYMKKKSAPTPPPILVSAPTRDFSDPKQRYAWMTEGGIKKCWDYQYSRQIDTDVCDTYGV